MATNVKAMKPAYQLAARLLARKAGITVADLATKLTLDEQPARSLIHRLRLRGYRINKIGNHRFRIAGAPRADRRGGVATQQVTRTFPEIRSEELAKVGTPAARPVKPSYILASKLLSKKGGITVKDLGKRLKMDEQPTRSLIHRLRLLGLKVDKAGKGRFHMEPEEMARLEDQPAAKAPALKPSYALASRLLLRKNGATVPELAEKLHASEQVARSLIHRLRRRGAKIDNIAHRRFRQTSESHKVA